MALMGQGVSAQNFITDTSGGNSCTDASGTLSGSNLFTEFDNGTLGSAVDSTAQLSPATNPFGSDLTGADYDQYNRTGFGEWTIVSNIESARNRFQHGGGIWDPVNGIEGRFFHIDPENFTQFPAVNLTGLRIGEEYQVSFWAADAELDAGNVSRVSILVDGATVFSTPNIDNGAADATLLWTQHSFNIEATATTAEVIIQIVDESLNAITNGSGRDIHMDEIAVQRCNFDPELEVTKTAGLILSSVGVGDELTYTFVVENTGNEAIENVVPVDAGPTFNSVTGATREGSNDLSAFSIVTEAGFCKYDGGWRFDG